MQASDLKVKIFADGADLNSMIELYRNPLVQGYTTNPTLMRKAGVEDYPEFAKNVLQHIQDRPISFEVFADDLEGMEQQAKEIASWGEQVVVKIPFMNTRGVSTAPLVRKLADAGMRVNVTAMMTIGQVDEILPALKNAPSSYISIFAGRIADTGRDPIPLMKEALSRLSAYPNVELIWASPREVLNIFQADSIGCHVITVTENLLKKLSLTDKDLSQFSLETVQMFYQDACRAGFSLNLDAVATL